MSRIPLAPVDEQVDEQPEAIRQFMARRGELNLFRLLANAPAVFIGWTQMVDEMFDSTTFGLRMRQLIILRVAHLQASGYELAQHLDLSRSAGLTDVQIDAITGDPDAAGFRAAGFSDTELAVLELITELCTTHRLPADTFAAVHAALGDEAITEMLMIIGCYYGLALVTNAVDLDIDQTARVQMKRSLP